MLNIYAVIILSTMIAGFVIELIADYLNLKNLGKELPEEFKDAYSPEKYSQSQLYTKVRTKFGIIMSTVNLIIIIIFWQAGGFNYIDYTVSQWSQSPIVRGIFFIGVMILLSSLVSMPFNIYSVFVIEEKFGFNKTTWKIFVADLGKTLFLSILIGAPLLALILYIFQSTGEYAWLIGFGAVSLFTLIVQLVYPKFIMPMFNKFKPLENEELNNAIMEYAKSVKFPVSNIFEMDGSKRSGKSNAFFTGFGKFKKIVLFDTLIQNHTIKELVAILAHEVGHFKKKHIITGTIIGIIHTGVIFWLLSVFLSQKGLFDAFYMDKMEIYSGLLFFGLLYSPVEMILSLFLNILSRKNEYEADRFAAETTRDREPMISALKKLSEHNLSNLTPHKFYVFVNYSHPPLAQRIENIKNLKL